MRSSLGTFQEAVRQRVDALAAGDGVGRVWRRDAGFWGSDDAQQRSVANRLGWLDAPAAMRERIPAIVSFAREVRDAGMRDVVLLGMGGSSLAPEVLHRTMAPADEWPRLHVLDTTDPGTILGVQRQIDLSRALFVVASKSGGTIEVASLFAHFHALVEEQRGPEAGEQFIAITDEGTSLQRLAHEHGFRRTFVNPSDIGGRYSALSYFGMVPAAIAGIDVERLLAAAIEQEEAAQTSDSEALRLGATLGEMALAGRDKLTLVIAPGIEALGLWLEQLIAESTGKHGRGILPVDAERLGAPDAYAQDRLFVRLRLAGERADEQDRAFRAIERAGQPVIEIELADPYDLGREFFRWEFATAFAGQVLGIDPFDEPNVQESKDNTARVLKEFDTSGRLGADVAAGGGVTAIDASGAARSLPDGIAELLAGLAPPQYFAITAFLGHTAAMDAAFAEIRRMVRDATGAATTLGYGPRFLHSTGQLHKGGPPLGVFLQVTADDPEDVAIPGKPFTFGQLKGAQAVGDAQSLIAHGRPILRVHLGADAYAGLEALQRAVRAALEAVVPSGR